MARYDFIACYIVANRRNGTLYTGLTSDLLARIQAHREGRGSAFAAKYGCRTLVWFEQAADMPTAIAREKDVKGLRRAWKLALIERANPTWRDLFDDFRMTPV